MQISMEYPDRNAELAILYQESQGNALDRLEPVLTIEQVIDLQKIVKSVKVEESLANYLLRIVEATRQDSRIELGCSPRGAVSFFMASKARAFMDGRDYVLPDDIQKMAEPVLRHRLVCRDNQVGAMRNQDRQWSSALISELVQTVEVPV